VERGEARQNRLIVHSDLPIYKATYDLLLAIFQFVKDFSKEYKYSVGEAMKKETMAMMTLIFRANTRNDRKEVLMEARERLEVIRLYVRLMKDLKQINVRKFAQLNTSIELVSRQLGGWIKASKS
jgi:hypothetical protein